MKRFFDVLRLVFISLEFTFTLISLAILMKSPNIFGVVGQVINEQETSIKALMIGFPFLLCVHAYKTGNAILFPDEKLRRIIIEWPEYQPLWDRVVFVWFICGLSAIGFSVSLLGHSYITNSKLGLISIWVF